MYRHIRHRDYAAEKVEGLMRNALGVAELGYVPESTLYDKRCEENREAQTYFLNDNR